MLFAGTWNHGPGPDFRDALLLAPGGMPLRGDLEIHRSPAGWAQHGHDRDPAYTDVILHVCGTDPAASSDGPRQRARLILGPPGSAPPCSRVVAEAGARSVAAALRPLGRERLLAKAGRFRAPSREPRILDATAYAALLAAIGRGGNEAVFRALAIQLPWPSLRADAARGDAAVVRERMQACLAAIVAVRAGRPANAPARRLDAAAVLIVRLGAVPWPGSFGRGLASLATLPEAEALRVLRVPGSLGAERARQILVDAVYPLASSQGAGEEALAGWLRLGGARYQRTAVLRDQLQQGGLQVWRNGETQALLSLERCYCRAGACAVCPIARLARGRLARGPRPSPNARFARTASAAGV